MSLRQLQWHAVEKVWGRRDFPTIFGDRETYDEPLGEVWYEDENAKQLLVKYLFTSDKLSIQVHPSDEEAQAAGYSNGKTEAWYVLSAEPGATIGAGFDHELTSEQLRAASLDGSIEELMTWHEVKPGDFFYVPAGTVHAIGAGVSLVEIQQNVDLTYRLYDYGRPRELHLDEGVPVSRPQPFVNTEPQPLGPTRELLVDGPKFSIERLTGGASETLAASERNPVWLMPTSDGCSAAGEHLPGGTVWLADERVKANLGPDDTMLIAYAAS